MGPVLAFGVQLYVTELLASGQPREHNPRYKTINFLIDTKATATGLTSKTNKARRASNIYS